MPVNKNRQAGHNRKESKMDEFRKELEHLINKHSMENASKTPDFLLAEYLVNCLMALDSIVEQREKWYREDEDKILDA